MLSSGTLSASERMVIAARLVAPGFFELIAPKFVTVLRERYGLADLKADAISGLTIAIVALPLSMAIAIASGATPDRGPYRSIIGGLIVSALGGRLADRPVRSSCSFSATVAQHGLDGLLLATMISGAILMAVGLLRLHSLSGDGRVHLRHRGIILASQMKELLGLTLDKEPGPLLTKLLAIGSVVPTANIFAIDIAALTIGAIVAVRATGRIGPPSSSRSGTAAMLGLPVETVGTRLGDIPAIALGGEGD